MNVPVIFEDETIIVIDKPSGVAVNRSENEKSETLQDWLEANYDFVQTNESAKDSDFTKRSGIVHRIDKETSGILVIAKNETAFLNLQKQFFDRSVTKTYTALTHGEITPEIQTIKATVGRLPWNRRKFGVIPEGREAETEILVVRTFKNSKNERYTLVEAKPKTGRTHQIRIHLKYIGNPIVSDPLYAGRKVLRSDLRFCPRLFLHATKLELRHPVTHSTLNFDSQLPQELKGAIEFIDKDKGNK